MSPITETNNIDSAEKRVTCMREMLEEMERDAEEYGQLHNEDCGVNREDECDCENMQLIKAFGREHMEKVNKHWYEMTEAHRPYCSPAGNKILTRILGKKNRNRTDTRSTAVKKSDNPNVIGDPTK